MISHWNKEQKDYYDSTADEYSEAFQQNNPYFQFTFEHYLRAIDPQAEERILELGSSGGRSTFPLLEAGCRVTGVDISAKSLQYLADRARGHSRRSDLTLLEDDAGALSKLTERNFDAVVGAHILHHVEDISKVAKRAMEFLRRGGASGFHGAESMESSVGRAGYYRSEPQLES